MFHPSHIALGSAVALLAATFLAEAPATAEDNVRRTPELRHFATCLQTAITTTKTYTWKDGGESAKQIVTVDCALEAREYCDSRPRSEAGCLVVTAYLARRY